MPATNDTNAEASQAMVPRLPAPERTLPHADGVCDGLAARDAVDATASDDEAVRSRWAAIADDRVRFAALVAASDQIVCTVSIDGRQLDATPAWQAFTGQTDAESLGTGWLAAVDADDQDALRAMWSSESALCGVVSCEIRVRRHDDVQRVMRLRAAPMCDGEGQVAAFVCALTDITEERDRLALLEQREAFAHRLLAVVGHDLRNPLSTIGNSTQVLQHVHRASDDQTTRMLASIDRATRRAGELINTILDIAGATLTAGLQVSPGPCDLRSLVTECVADAMARNPGREITVRVHGTEGATGAFDGTWDGPRLQQVVGNLLSNALAHGTPGCRVDVLLDAAAERVYLDVSNPSATIPAERLATIFQPVSTRSSATATSSGLGFGLYIVQQLVAAHGGRVWATSEAGTTRFHVELPRTAVLPPAAFLSQRATSRALPALPVNVPRRQAPAYLQHMHDPRIRRVLTAWCESCTPLTLPAPADLLTAELTAWMQDICCVVVRREADAGAWTFRFVQVGAALERRIGRPLAGLEVTATGTSGDQTLQQWVQSYVQACADGEPAYSYVRFGRSPLGGAGTSLIERLVVPCSADRNRHVTDLISIVRFTGFDDSLT